MGAPEYIFVDLEDLPVHFLTAITKHFLTGFWSFIRLGVITIIRLGAIIINTMTRAGFRIRIYVIYVFDSTQKLPWCFSVFFFFFKKN
jgi:hypothetical protein